MEPIKTFNAGVFSEIFSETIKMRSFKFYMMITSIKTEGRSRVEDEIGLFFVVVDIFLFSSSLVHMFPPLEKTHFNLAFF